MGKTPRGDIDEEGEVESGSPQDNPGSNSKTGKSSPQQDDSGQNEGGSLQFDGGDDNEEMEEPQDEEEGEETETVGAKAIPKDGVFEYEECGDDECETQMIF